MGDPANLLPDDAAPHRALGAAGAKLIKGFEGCGKPHGDGRFEAYPDPGTGGQPWTIGWGSTGPDVVKGTVWTQGDCDRRFLLDAQHFVHQVAVLIGAAQTSQNQFDAMVSFQYNTGHLAGSTLLAKHAAGDFAGAAAEFAKWTHAGGQVLPGLVKRRAAEARLYATR